MFILSIQPKNGNELSSAFNLPWSGLNPSKALVLFSPWICLTTNSSQDLLTRQTSTNDGLHRLGEFERHIVAPSFKFPRPLSISLSFFSFSFLQLHSHLPIATSGFLCPSRKSIQPIFLCARPLLYMVVLGKPSFLTHSINILSPSLFSPLFLLILCYSFWFVYLAKQCTMYPFL